MNFIISKLNNKILRKDFKFLGKDETDFFLFSTNLSLVEISELSVGIEYYVIGEVDDSIILEKFPSIIKRKILEIGIIAEAKRLELSPEYLSTERETWTQQSEEAQLYNIWHSSDQSGLEPPTPFLDNFYIYRETTKMLCVEGILENTALFNESIGMIQGLQYKYIDQINSAATLIEALSVEWI